MENEEFNTANSVPETEKHTGGGKAGRSKVERTIVWTVIGLLAVITGIEAAARYGYNNTLASLEAAVEDPTQKSFPLSFADFESEYKKGFASKVEEYRDGKQTVIYRWPSLLKKYELGLTLWTDKDKSVREYFTTDGNATTLNVDRRPLPKPGEIAPTAN